MMNRADQNWPEEMTVSISEPKTDNYLECTECEFETFIANTREGLKIARKHPHAMRFSHVDRELF
jgi:hypothetical protein